MEAFEPDLYEQDFLLHILQTKSYHLLAKRIDYLTRQFSRNENLVYELYLDLFLAGEQKLTKIITEQCDIPLYRVFKLAIQRKMKLSDLEMELTDLQKMGYYIVLLEEDSLGLFLEQETELRSFLDEKTCVDRLIKNNSLRIIHHLCKQGRHEDIITEYLTHSLLSWEGLDEKEYTLLASICDQYSSAEFLTLKLTKHASDYSMQKVCRLLFRSGANPNEEQRQEIMRKAPILYKELFVEDV